MYSGSSYASDSCTEPVFVGVSFKSGVRASEATALYAAVRDELALALSAMRVRAEKGYQVVDMEVANGSGESLPQPRRAPAGAETTYGNADSAARTTPCKARC